jgi:hypothetical protein
MKNVFIDINLRPSVGGLGQRAAAHHIFRH